MVFAEFAYEMHYSEFHAGLLACVKRHFSRVEAGLQGDSWIWIFDGDERVSIDTFTSMKHQVKSPRPGVHVQRVIDALRDEFQLHVHQEPEREAHEDG
jgi:hypothetical protein